MNIDTWYGTQLLEILAHAPREKNVRTGKECAAMPGITFQTHLGKEGFPLLGLRKIPIKNFVAEQCWFLSGGDKIADLEPYTKIWSSFAEPAGNVTSAYGMRWRNWFSRQDSNAALDQLAIVLEKLKQDPSTRHGVIMMWDASYDLQVPQKNVPCPYTFTLMIIGGELHMHLIVRSNDMVLGFPTDVAGFAFLLMILAQHLGVKPGMYTHSISNSHVYEDHYEAAHEMCKRWASLKHTNFWPELLPGALEKASIMDPTFIDETIKLIEVHYSPYPAIGGLILSK